MSGLAAIAAAFLVVTVSPGPANLALATTAMARGSGPALRMALGLALGLAFWGVLAAAGLGALLAASGPALTALKIVGALYLGWLAIGAARNALTTGVPAAARIRTGRWALRGLMLNLSNPKAVLAWLAALAVGLTPEAGVGAVATATALCALIGLANYLGWALLFSRGGAMTLYARARRGIEAGTAALMGAAAIGFLRSAAQR